MVVSVLGMHRSGTSWLGGSLQEMGLALGNVNMRAIHNAKGNRENQQIRQLHEAVLNANGGDWRHPRYPNAWTPAQRGTLITHIQSMNQKSARWAFKDP